MSENKKNIPKRRFKQFQNEAPWEKRKLGDMCIEMLAGGDVDKSKLTDVGSYPVLANALTNDGIVGYYENDYRVKAPAVTITGRGDVGHAKARKQDFTPVVRLLAIRSTHDVDFLENAINTLKIMIESTGVPQLTVPQLEKYELFIPRTIKEEKQIGSYFQQLDNLITLHQRKLEKIKALKSAYLSEMFPAEGERKPKRRFAGFTDDWEQRKLGDIADVTKLAGFEFTEHVEYSEQGSIIALRGLNVKNGMLVLDDVKYIDGSNFSKLGRSKLYIGDILFTYVGTVGEVAIINEDDRFYLAPNVSRIRVKSDDLPQYISHYMRNRNFYNSVIFPLIATSSQPALSMESIRKFEILLPRKKSEQIQIANYFTNLDNLITLHQRKLDKLQNIKKAYLNEMFV